MMSVHLFHTGVWAEQDECQPVHVSLFFLYKTQHMQWSNVTDVHLGNCKSYVKVTCTFDILEYFLITQYDCILFTPLHLSDSPSFKLISRCTLLQINITQLIMYAF